jgi:glycine C-acetyltransferase
VDHYNMHGRVDIQVGTLSKAVGSLGGYVCGSRELIEFLYHRARPFLFSTSHPPSVTASCIAAFELLEESEELTAKLWENTRFFKKRLAGLGFNTGMSETPITPIIVGDAARAFAFSRNLFEEGVFAQAVGYPTVPEGKARIRTIVTATHTRSELERALEILGRVGKKLGII